MPLDPLNILIDTREQRPWDFPTEFRGRIITTQRATLKTGDYTLKGHEKNGLCIERKESWDEIAANVGKHRARFRAEFARMMEFQTRILVLCEPLDTVMMGVLRTRMDPRSLVGSVLGLCEEHRVFLFIAQDRHAGMRYALSAMSRHLTRTARIDRHQE